MIRPCTALHTIHIKAQKLSIVRPDKDTVYKTKDLAKSIFVEAFRTTYTGYHQKSESKLSIEAWLRLKEGYTITSWLEATFDGEFEEFEKGEKDFIHLNDESGTLIGWLSHGKVSEIGDVYLSQCSLEAQSRNQRVASTAFQEVLQNKELIQTVLPGAKEFKLIARKINEYADKLYTQAGFTKDETIDPKVYGESYDDRYVGYRKKL